MYILHENDIFLLFPELFLSTAAICLLMYGVTHSALGHIESTRSNPSENKPAVFKNEGIKLMMSNVIWLCSLCVLLTGMLVINNPVDSALLFFHSLLIDDLTSFFKLLVLLGSGVCFLMSISYFQNEKINAYEYAILMLLATCSMLLMISSYDLISLYLTIELQSLCFYVLAASKRQSEFSTEAGLKYFLLGAFSSGILLFGSSIIYGFTGSTNFGHLAQLFTGASSDYITFGANHGMLIGVLFVAVGFLFKLSAAPFHMWAPDVYEGAPTAITALFSIVPKIAFLAGFLRLFVITLHDFLPQWQPIIILCSLLSMLVGAFAALSQNKIKRVLAFSAVGHIGYILMGTCCGTIEGIQAVCIYLVIYILMTICIFACILSLRSNESTSGGSIKYIQDLSILAHTNPVLAITLAVCLFSMAGVPPLAGFCSKFFLFFAALSSSLYVLAFVGIATSCISCFYYIRLIKIMYFEKVTRTSPFNFAAIDKQKGTILALTLFVIIFFFLYPAPLFITTHKLALSLCI